MDAHRKIMELAVYLLNKEYKDSVDEFWLFNDTFYAYGYSEEDVTWFTEQFRLPKKYEPNDETRYTIPITKIDYRRIKRMLEDM